MTDEMTDGVTNEVTNVDSNREFRWRCYCDGEELMVMLSQQHCEQQCPRECERDAKRTRGKGHGVCAFRDFVG